MRLRRISLSDSPRWENSTDLCTYHATECDKKGLMGHFSHIPVFTCLNPVLNYSAKLRH